MTPALIVLVTVVVLAGMICVALLFGVPLPFSAAEAKGNIRNVVTAQRLQTNQSSSATSRLRKNELMRSVEESKVDKRTDAKLTLKKRLKYAQWPISKPVFHAFEIGISLMVFALVSLKMNLVMQVAALFSGPLFMRWLLTYMVDRRFKRFDADYPQFLLSLVGLLKTGMTAMGALEAAAQGLEDGSLVKEEVEMMIERLRFGVSEDKSIGTFGEDIYHPEIELFVQALLLNRRVGGNLSDTLERLAKQVRKRQFFRASANAAVSMQRGSIWIIIAILVGIETYIYIMYPQLVVAGLESEVGWQVWQAAILVILLGIYWVRQVTKIKI